MDLGSGFGIAARSICTATTPTASISAPRNQNAQFWDCYQSSQPGRKHRHHRAGRERGSVLALALGIHSCFMIAWLKSTVFDSWISSRYRTHPSEIHPALLQVPAHHLRRLIFFIRAQCQAPAPSDTDVSTVAVAPAPAATTTATSAASAASASPCSVASSASAMVLAAPAKPRVVFVLGGPGAGHLEKRKDHFQTHPGPCRFRHWEKWLKMTVLHTYPQVCPHAPVALITFSNMF